MSNIRARGADSELLLLVNGAPIVNFTNFKDLSITFEIDKTEEQYLGEAASRYDDLFKGISLSMTFHIDSPDAFAAMDRIIERASRRDPTAVFNLKTSVNFPGRGRVRYIFTNLFFGSLPLNIGSRADYMSLKLEASCSEYQRL